MWNWVSFRVTAMGSYVREPVSFMIREKGFPLSTIRVVRKGWLNEVKIDEFVYDFEWSTQILKDIYIYGIFLA